MKTPRFGKTIAAFLLLLAGCQSDGGIEPEQFETGSSGIFCLCEGNMNAGNASLSYYDPATCTVQNEVFLRANGAKLGDVAQSATLNGNRLFIPVSNSGIIWALNASTFRIEGQIRAASVSQPDDNNHIVSPRYIHIVNDSKGYITDLFSPWITIFDPSTCRITGAIPTGEEASTDHYNSTEQMARWGKWLFVACWSYSNRVLVIDTERDEVVDRITLESIQPNSLAVDRYGKLWVLTDGGFAESQYGQTPPALYRIDAETRRIEQEFRFEQEESPSELCIDGAGETLYFINDGICRMPVTATHAPVRPLIPNDRRHRIYGLAVDPHNGEIYVGDAIDHQQPGVVYRYRIDGERAEEIDSFGVGMLPSAFAFK